MSKIGVKVIEIPTVVKVTVEGSIVKSQGKEGEMTVKLPDCLKVIKDENTIKVVRSNDQKKTVSLHGLYRQLVYNAVIGVDKPWEKKLEIVGTGYNCKMQGEDLVFKLGYSHPVIFKKVEGIKYKLDEDTKVTVYGADKQLVGQIAYQIKQLKKPDSYKGKGIRYLGERIKLKPSKKVKATGGAA